MKQILLATALIALPVGAFTAFTAFTAFNLCATQTTASTGSAGLGDLSAFVTIITDVQADAAKGDFAAAKTRIKDFELAWDENAKGLRSMDPASWDEIDGAADAALSAVRATSPDAAQITDTLAALQTAMAVKP